MNKAGDEIVEDARDSGDVGVSSDPPPASPLSSLRPAKSMPGALPPREGALVATSSTASRPVSASSGGMKRFYTWLTRRKGPASASNGEIVQEKVSPAEATKGKVSFRWTFPWVEPPTVYGFDMELQALESFVRRENDQGFRAVAVVGAGGIGKTTLCQCLFNDTGIQAAFAPRIWVSISGLRNEGGDLKAAIVERMLNEIGEDEMKDMDLDKLMPLLHRNLWGKKYLIVLDDAADADRWYYNLGAVPNMEEKWMDRLAYGLPKGSGGRIVVTVRNEEVARKMVGDNSLHKVMPLSDLEHCWAIFEESAELNEAVKNRMNIRAMMGEVYEKSAGIPLAIKVMGQIAKEQIREKGEDIIERTETF